MYQILFQEIRPDPTIEFSSATTIGLSDVILFRIAALRAELGFKNEITLVDDLTRNISMTFPTITEYLLFFTDPAMLELRKGRKIFNDSRGITVSVISIGEK